MNENTCICTKHFIENLKVNPSIRKVLQEKNKPSYGLFISKKNNLSTIIQKDFFV